MNIWKGMLSRDKVQYHNEKGHFDRQDPSLRVSSGSIRNVVCKGKDVNVEGVCMFAWNCILKNGTHVGTCIDRFYIGSCCLLPNTSSFYNNFTTLSDSHLTSDLTSVQNSTTSPSPLLTVTVTPENQKTTTNPNDMISNGITTKLSPSMLSTMDHREACGRVFYKEAPTGRIVNGQEAQYAKWPWQISVRIKQFRGKFIHKCGAALLNENWAVTAAHCVNGRLPGDFVLRMGEFDLDSSNEPLRHVERRIEQIIVHPKFHSQSFENDLALVRFQIRMQFQEHIIPICLPLINDTFVNETGYATGWGKLFYVNGPLPTVLQEVQLPIITNSECEQEYRKAGYLEHIPDIFLCAGFEKGEKDSCEGDSGGPLVVKQGNGRWVLAGIISWGIGCGLPHQPGVYTRISHFRQWIDEII
ncbi:hypothetical protein CHUAL_001778 [Chamberlinius hualienensis]